MRKNLIFILIVFVQTSDIIKLNDYYSGEGIIFNKDHKYPFVEPDYKTSYTPTINDIKETENFVFNNYYEYEINVLDSFNLDKSIKIKFKKKENVKRLFFRYNRQYAGYTNKSNDTIIYIGLLNFSNKKLTNNYFEGWKDNIFFGFDGFYQKNQKNYRYNLSKKKFVYKLPVRKT